MAADLRGWTRTTKVVVLTLMVEFSLHGEASRLFHGESEFFQQFVVRAIDWHVEAIEACVRSVTNKQTDNWMNERKNEWVNERTNESYE